MSNTFRNQNFTYVNSVKWMKYIKNVDHKHHILKMSDGVVGREFFDKDVLRNLVYGKHSHEIKKMISRIKRARAKNTLTCVMMNTKKIDIIFNK